MMCCYLHYERAHLKGIYPNNVFLETIRLFEREDTCPEIVYFGDSVLRRAAEEDQDPRNLCEIMAEAIKGYRVYSAAVSTLDFGRLYYNYLQMMQKCPFSPKVIIFHLNLRSFSPVWYLNPRYQYEVEVGHLKNWLANPDYHVPDIVSVDERGVSAELQDRYLNTHIDFPFEVFPTVGDYVKTTSTLPVTYEEYKKRQKNLFIAHYLYRLEKSHPRLKLFESISRIHRALESRVIIYLTPINYEAGAAFAGQQFLTLLDRRRKFLSRFLTRHLPEPKGFFLDLSTTLKTRCFFHQDYAAEHLSIEGRRRLVSVVSEAVQNVLDEKKINSAVFQSKMDSVSPGMALNILFVIDYDAAMDYTVPVIRALKQRGHRVDVLVFDDDVNTTRGLRRWGTPYDLLTIPIRNAGNYDIAVCMSHKEIRDHLIENNVYTCVLLLSMSPRTKGDAAESYCDCDLMMVAGRHIQAELRASGCLGEIIATGIPRYDGIVPVKPKNAPFFLYVDVGRHPASIQERRLMLERLVEIARCFPEYRMIVKPRYTHNTRDVTAHYHGADYFTLLEDVPDVPDNFVVLDTQEDLETLIAACSVLICFPSTCTLPAMMLRKPMLVLKGGGFNEAAPPGEPFGVASNYPYFEKTGCMIDVNDLPRHLPQGLIPNEAFVSREISSIGQNATALVVDILEKAARAVRLTGSQMPYMALSASNYEEKYEKVIRQYRKRSHRWRYNYLREYAVRRGKSILLTKINMIFNRSEVPHRVFRQLIPLLIGWIDGAKGLPLDNENLHRVLRHLISIYEDQLKRYLERYDYPNGIVATDLCILSLYDMFIKENEAFNQYDINRSRFLDQLVFVYRKTPWWPMWLYMASQAGTGLDIENILSEIMKETPESAHTSTICFLISLAKQAGSFTSVAAQYTERVCLFFLRAIETNSLRLLAGLDLFSKPSISSARMYRDEELYKTIRSHLLRTPLFYDTDRYKRGSLLEWIGDYREAERDFLEISNSKDRNLSISGAFYHLGVIYKKTSRTQDARKALQKCLERAPGFQAAKKLIQELT